MAAVELGYSSAFSFDGVDTANVISDSNREDGFRDFGHEDIGVSIPVSIPNNSLSEEITFPASSSSFYHKAVDFWFGDHGTCFGDPFNATPAVSSPHTHVLLHYCRSSPSDPIESHC